jgi:hypothetical protein
MNLKAIDNEHGTKQRPFNLAGTSFSCTHLQKQMEVENYKSKYKVV